MAVRGTIFWSNSLIKPAAVFLAFQLLVPKPHENHGVVETSPLVKPSPVSLWAESEVGPVYAQETHYAKPSPDGRYLYIFNMDSRNILVLDLETRTVVGDIKMPGFWSQASEIIFSSDGQWMYTLSDGFDLNDYFKIYKKDDFKNLYK